MMELGPEHMSRVDYILYYRPLENFVSLGLKSLRRAQDGMRNLSCISAGRKKLSLPYLEKAWFGSAAPPAVINPTPSSAWHSWLWGRGHRRM